MIPNTHFDLGIECEPDAYLMQTLKQSTHASTWGLRVCRSRPFDILEANEQGLLNNLCAKC